MPPRTANFRRASRRVRRGRTRPRRAPRPSRSDRRSARCAARRAPGRRAPCTCGCSTERTGATTTDTGPVSGSSVLGWARRRSTARRRPTVSERGEAARAAASPTTGTRRRRPAAAASAAPRQVLGLAAGGGDGQHGPLRLAGERRHREGARRGRAHEVDVHAVAVARGLHRFGEGRVLDDGVEQSVQAHGGLDLPGPGVGNAKDPTRVTGRGVPGYVGARRGADRAGPPRRSPTGGPRSRPLGGLLGPLGPIGSSRWRWRSGRSSGPPGTRRDQGGEQAHEGRADEDRDDRRPGDLQDAEALQGPAASGPSRRPCPGRGRAGRRRGR